MIRKIKSRLFTNLREQADDFLWLLCRDWNTLDFFHSEEELTDIHIQLDVQVIVAVNVNAFDHRIDYHFLCFNRSAVVQARPRNDFVVLFVKVFDKVL